MTDETGAAAPVTEQAQPAPAASEPATPKDTSVPNTDAVAENAETQGKPETEQTADAEASDEPRRLTRSQRQQRKVARLSTVVAEQAAEIERLRQATEKSAADGPKEADFNGDYIAFQTAKAAHDAAQLIRKDLNERDQRSAQAQLNERKQEAADEFQERAEQIKASIPDFDTVVASFANAGGKFAPHVIEELLESDKGPMLAYQLAKAPNLAAELNAMSPRDAAREIGRLEAKVSLPQPRTQTKAPAPLTAVKGGAAATSDLAQLAARSDDATAYWKARRAQDKASA